MSRFRLLQQLQQRAVGTALRTISSPISLPDLHAAPTQLLARQMVATMQRAQGVGLASAQVGKNVRMFVAELDDAYEHEEEDAAATKAAELARSKATGLVSRLFGSANSSGTSRPQPSVIINPRILRSSSRLTLGIEGCLSLPGLVGRVPRAESLDVSYLDLEGRLVTQTLRGFRARIFAHELDHLNGVLFIDKIQTPEHIWTDEAFPDDQKL